jgi:hypothetical protein
MLLYAFVETRKLLTEVDYNVKLLCFSGFKDIVHTPTGGSFQSPGFPNPFPSAANFTWHVTARHVQQDANGQDLLFASCKILDLTFHTMETGPDQFHGSSPQALDCTSDVMRTVVFVYRDGVVDERNLEMRLVTLFVNV